MIEDIRFALEIITCTALLITMIFAILYWKATFDMKQEMVKQSEISLDMKKEMVKQSKISFQSQEISNIPLLDISVQNDKESENTWNTFIENKGMGPAFRVFIIMNTYNDKSKKENLKNTSSITIKTIGKGEKNCFLRQFQNTAGFKNYKIKCFDIFGEIREYEFEGDKNEIKIIKYPVFENFSEEER